MEVCDLKRALKGKLVPSFIFKSCIPVCFYDLPLTYYLYYVHSNRSVYVKVETLKGWWETIKVSSIDISARF
jgi:hypothetical protein